MLMGVEYVSRAPRPPLDSLIDDLYYLDGSPPYARLTLPPSPAAVLIVNLGAPFLPTPAAELRDRPVTIEHPGHVLDSWPLPAD